MTQPSPAGHVESCGYVVDIGKPSYMVIYIYILVTEIPWNAIHQAWLQVTSSHYGRGEFHKPLLWKGFEWKRMLSLGSINMASSLQHLVIHPRMGTLITWPIVTFDHGTYGTVYGIPCDTYLCLRTVYIYIYLHIYIYKYIIYVELYSYYDSPQMKPRLSELAADQSGPSSKDNPREAESISRLAIPLQLCFFFSTTLGCPLMMRCPNFFNASFTLW